MNSLRGICECVATVVYKYLLYILDACLAIRVVTTGVMPILYR